MKPCWAHVDGQDATHFYKISCPKRDRKKRSKSDENDPENCAAASPLKSTNKPRNFIRATQPTTNQYENYIRKLILNDWFKVLKDTSLLTKFHDFHVEIQHA